MDIKQINKKLEILIKNAYAPYSNFKVASIVIGDDGVQYCGVNVENASFGATICAERSAICSAISAGCKKIHDVFVFTQSGRFDSPCGICLQVISEFMVSKGSIYLINSNSQYKIFRLENFLPIKAFSILK